MKVRNHLLIFLLVGFLTSCQEEFNKLQDKIDEVKTSEIAPIKSQIDSIKVSIGELEEMDVALKSYIDTLETTAENLRTAIEETDAELRSEMNARLKTIDSTLTVLKANDTSLVNSIAKLKTYVDTQISNTQEWANGTFSTLEQYNATVAEITALKASITTLINNTIQTIQGNITTLQSQVEALLARIQSIVVIPDYSDGSVACTTGSNQFHFEVLPAGSAALLAQAPLSSFALKAVYTRTKAQTYISIPISAVSAEGDVLTITASGENLTGISSEISANACLKITVGASSQSTGYFPLYFDSTNAPITVSFSDLTPVSVNIDGNISEQDGVSEYGICYSMGSPLCGSSVQGSGMDAQGKFRITLSELVPGKDYYYKAYAIRGGAAFYSEVKSFTSPTLDAYIHTDSVSGVGTFSATISANISNEIKDNAGVNYGICYSSTNENPVITDSKVVVEDSDSEGNYSVVLLSLLAETHYNCRAYVTAYGETSYGSVVSFTTPKFIIDSDLSAGGTSNCYIVPSSGKYKFKGNVKGNSSTPLDGTPVAAELLWESFGTDVAPAQFEMITGVSYMNDYVFFETASSLKEGNAVIAVKDADDNILWSWHIWMCIGYNPNVMAQVYYNDAGTMMDRNLGATSATPGEVGALGLLYQWGRKDPFLGGCSISHESSSAQTKAASTLSWPSAVYSTSSWGTIAYAVSHPTTFIKPSQVQTSGNKYYDWYYTGSSSTDSTRWQSTKTIYDPCPPGWRIPDGGDNGVWSKAYGSSFPIRGYSFDDVNKGMNLSGIFGDSGQIWYPAAGYYSRSSNLESVGSDSLCWSCTSNEGKAYVIYISSIINQFDYEKASGHSVRCQKE